MALSQPKHRPCLDSLQIPGDRYRALLIRMPFNLAFSVPAQSIDPPYLVQMSEELL